jgi:hypothetical protein
MENEVPEASPETKALNATIDAQPAENIDPADVAATAEAEASKEEPKERHPLEKELAKERRRISNLTRRNHDFERELQDLRNRLTPTNNPAKSEVTDSESLTLSRSELERLVQEEAKRLAPNVSRQQDQETKMRAAAAAVRKELGPEAFEELTGDLASLFDGPRQMAVLRTEKPAAVLRYLTDPDNAAEADTIRSMDDFDAGRAIASIEAKLKKADEKPKPSKAVPPIEDIRGQGNTPKSLFDLDGDAFVKKRREQVANRR